MFELNQRNKRALLILAVFLIPFLLINFIYFPYTDYKSSLKKRIRVKKKQLSSMIDMERTVLLYKKHNKGDRKSIQNFSLYSFMYNLAGKCGIKDRINYIKPSSVKNAKRGVTRDIVEIEFKNAPMDLFTKLLYETENSKFGLTVTRLLISQSGSLKRSINIIMHIESLKS